LIRLSFLCFYGYHWVSYLPGVPFDATPELFEWMDKFRRLTCDKTVEEEIIPMWSKYPGLIEKLGNLQCIFQ